MCKFINNNNNYFYIYKYVNNILFTYDNNFFKHFNNEGIYKSIYINILNLYYI